MSAADTGTKRRWLASGAIAGVLVAAVLALFRVPVTQAPARARIEKPPIVLSPRRSDELAMRDLAPLFLPTPYNARAITTEPREPGSAYFERDPGIHTMFDVNNPALQLPAPVQPPRKPVDALANPPPPLAAGIGRSDSRIEPLSPNGGHLDVFAGDRHESILGMTLGPDAAAPLAGRETLGWKPLEFEASVDAGGLVGPLLLTTSSGVEEVDNHFRNYLARVFRIGDRLPPGFYRIVVGP